MHAESVESGSALGQSLHWPPLVGGNVAFRISCVAGARTQVDLTCVDMRGGGGGGGASFLEEPETVQC